MAEEMLIQRFTNEVLKRMMKTIGKMDETCSFDLPVVVKWPTLRNDYRQIIKQPMDLETITKKINNSQYKFFELTEFLSDVQLIGLNCMEYNKTTPSFYQIGDLFLKRGEAYIKPILAILTKNIKQCRAGVFAATEIKKGISYVEKKRPPELKIETKPEEVGVNKDHQTKDDQTDGKESESKDNAVEDLAIQIKLKNEPNNNGSTSSDISKQDNVQIEEKSDHTNNSTSIVSQISTRATDRRKKRKKYE